MIRNEIGWVSKRDIRLYIKMPLFIVQKSLQLVIKKYSLSYFYSKNIFY